MPSIDIAHEIIDELRHFARLYSLDSLFVVGGFCRARIMGDKEVNDIDVASAYPHDAIRLCGLFASEVLHTTPTFYHRTGTGVVEHREIKIEFQNQSSSSYMKNDEIRRWMRKNGIEDNLLLVNIHGRDFTINSLILSLKNGEMYDLTKRAVDDIKAKRIASILPASLVMKYDPLIILRAIRFASKYDFFIVPTLRKVMKQNLAKLVESYSQERITNEIEKILQANTKRGLNLLQKYDLMSLVVPKQLEKYLKIEKRD